MNKTASVQLLIRFRKIRLYTFVLVLLLIVPTVLPAVAGSIYLSIQELRESTPVKWTENLHGGKKIECTVDADIVIPEVDRFPILTVIPQGKIPELEETGYYIDDNDEYEYMVKTMSDKKWEKLMGDLGDLSSSYEDEMTEEQIRDADKKARELFSKVWDLNGTDLEKLGIMRTTDTTSKYRSVTVFYCPVYNGIAYLQCPGSIYVIKGVARRPYNSIYAFWQENIEYEGSCSCIPRVTGEYLPDVPLLSFEDIQEAIRGHIEAGYVQQIDELRLGYICLNDPDRPGENFYLTPAWIGCGDINPWPNIPFYPDNDPISRYEAPLAVNAQTGEIIHVDSQKKEIFDAHILTWDDVH